MRPWLVLLLVAAAAGCLAPNEPPACASVTVPPARAGDAYTYAAEGRYWSLNNVAYVDWSAINPDTEQTRDEEPSLHLAPGSTVEVHVADQARPRLDLYARRPNAYQVTYWADEPQEPSDLPFKDEWVHAGTGRLVQESDRTYLVNDDKIRHFTRFQNRQPPMWMAPAFWDRALTTGSTGRHTYYAGDVVPLGLDHDELLDRDSDGYRWTVQDLVATDDGCVATVSVSADVASTRYDGTLRWSDRVPMPIDVHWEIPWLGQPFTMSLQEHRPGDGSRLPAFDPGPLLGRGTAMEMRRPQDGFIYHGADIFTTEYPTAVEAIKDTDHARSWFDDHPDARVFDAEHTVGAPGDDDLEQWSITWADPGSDDAFGGAAWREEGLPVVNDSDELKVSTWTDTIEKPLSPGDDRWATMGAMADAFRTLYGQEPEVAACGFGWLDGQQPSTCPWGTRRSVNSAGAGHIGHGAAFHMDPRRGWMRIDDAYTNASLADPVR